MKSPKFILYLFLLCSLACLKSYAQCPTVINNEQTFCDLDSLLVSDLQAIDAGGGVAWFETTTSLIPLNDSDSLIDGQTYYVDNSTGTCGNRQAVLVNVLGPPIGLNFQGVCVENASDATLNNLEAFGNDVQWYLSSSGGTPLNTTTILSDNTIYYADQSSPFTGCRTSRLSVFVNVGVVDVPVGDSIQEFCIISGNNNPTIGDLVVSGTNNWYLSISSALPLELSEPLIDGQTYYATSLDPPCESDNRKAVTVNLIQQPNPGINGTIDLCENESNSINLFDSLGGTPDAGGTWSPALNSGTGVFDPNIDAPGVYTYTVASASPACSDDSANVTVAFITPPVAGTDGTIDLCENESNSINLFDSLGGTPEAGGTWSPALNSGTGVFDPNIDAPGIYTYTVASANPACSDDSANVTVTFITAPMAGTDGTADLCENESNLIDLFDSLGGTPDTGGTWSPALNSGTGVFDPNIDAPGVYTYTVASTNPICEDDSANVTVTFITAPMAGTDGTIDLCENESNSINLFDSLGGNPEAGGTWSPALNSGTGVFDPNIDAPGVYTYTVTSANPACSDDSANVTVTFITAPMAGTNGTIDLCENESNSINLFDSLGGTPDTGGTWSPALNSGTGVFDPNIDAPGVYTYTVASANPICEDDSANVTVTFITAPMAGTDGTIDLCENESNLIDLFGSLGGNPEADGTWSPALNSGTGVFDPSIDPEGVYTYTVTSANPACSDDSANVTVTFITAPMAGTDGTIDLCENESNSINLFDSLGGTPDAGGTWSPALNSGTGVFDPNIDAPGVYTYTVASMNPICEDDSANVTVTFITAPMAGTDGTIDLCENESNSINLFDSLGGTPEAGGTWSPALNSGTGVFDPNIDAPGVYTYTVASANPACSDDSANVTVTFITPPVAGTDGTIDLCENESNSINLFDSLGGNPEAGGTWSPALNSGTGVFDPNIDAPGVYTYTVTSANPACSDDSANVTVTFITAPMAGTDGTIDLCENESNSINLFDSLGGTPDAGGTWSPALNSGTGVFDPNIDAPGVYTYTVASTNPICEDDSANVTVTFITAPMAGTDGTIDLCENESNSINLFDSLGGNPEAVGTWSPTLNSGTGVFDPNIDAPGVYTYTVASANPACSDDSANVTVTFITAPMAGTDGTIDLCENESNSINLFDSLGGTPDAGGTWSPALNSGTGVFDPNIDAPGVYTYTVASANPECSDDSANVTVTFITAPMAGTDGTIDLCENESNSINLFDSLGGTPDAGGTWSPALNSGTGVFDPNIDAPGVYTYTVASTNPACSDDSANVTVTFITTPIAGADGSVDLCENESNLIDLFDSLGGTPDVGGTWSPALNSGTGVFDPNIDAPGVYTYTVTSTNPECSDDSANVTVTFITAPMAGVGGTVDLCENESNSINLFDSLSGNPDAGGTWSPALNSGTGVFDPNIDAPGVYTYTVTSTNPACSDDSTAIIINIISAPNAGEDNLINLCQGDNEIVDLFDSLGGTPDVGGTWSPALNSGTGVFDPSIDPEGVYTYTVISNNSICNDDSASIVVNLTNPPFAGTNGTLDICEDDTTIYNLFDSLGGTPDSGGTWSPALNSGTGVFDPNIDAPGVYTYTVSSNNTICEDVSADIIVSLILPPSAGIDGILNLCEDSTNSVDLFDSLDGNPNFGGTWSPALNSGTGIFDPSIDLPGIYTYTVNQPECNLNDSSEVVVTINENPNINNINISIPNTCLGQDVNVMFSDLNLLLDGLYSLSYNITGPSNNISDNVMITVTNGNTSFLIPNNSFLIPGIYEFSLIDFFNPVTNCQADLSNLTSYSFEILEAVTPELTDNGNLFCTEDNATIQDLSNNITTNGNIQWYNAAIDGMLLDNNELLQDGVSYFASITIDNGCSSINRLEVIVNIESCDEDIIIPDGFSPNGDGINDTFVIKNLEENYPNFKLTIYNRNGNKLYEGNINTPKWNGTTTVSRLGGGNLPVGVYFYILEFNDGLTNDKQGRVYLSR
ncbi:gliding motility-associated C-terminal domain-containing protein [Psychroserpens sp. S379A]|uniref:T9SS type B sorting domain-containing protein n=1 Tax=Psychroserpens sp. S379A TaxID=3415137 RepID=UPI003C7E5259